MRFLLMSAIALHLCVAPSLLSQGLPGTDTPTVLFYQIYTFTGFEGLLESKFPGIEDEPTIVLLHEQFENAASIEKWIKDLYGLDMIDNLDINTVVEVYYNGTSEVSPTFFTTGFSSEFTVWWFGGANTLLPELITVSMAADYEGSGFIPQFQLTHRAKDFVLVAKRCALALDEREELNSFDEFSLGSGQIFFCAVRTYMRELNDGDEYQPLVEEYMNLRGQQKARAGTIPLVEDSGYQLIENVFRECFSNDDFGYAKHKRLPISVRVTEKIFEEYDVPPKLVRGTEVIGRALARVFTAEEQDRLQGTRVNLLINEKGRIDEMRVESPLGQEEEQKLMKALKLMKWEPALFENKPVKVWTVLILP